MGFKVAVVGATGNVGREMLDILAERRFPADEVVALASARSIGTEVSFGDKTLKCKSLENFDFSGTDICLMSAGGTVSKEWSPKIGAQGCVVIDNSSAWRYESNVPLIVPEVNADAITGFSKRNIIANPNCSTVQLVVALKPLHDKAKIKRVVVATYQSVSGAGKEAMDELFAQTRAVFVSDPVQTKKFAKRIAFNVIPEIDVFMEDGFTKEEWKMMAETKKILDPKIKLVATCVRVPVFIGHSEAVNVEFEKPITAQRAVTTTVSRIVFQSRLAVRGRQMRWAMVPAPVPPASMSRKASGVSSTAATAALVPSRGQRRGRRRAGTSRPAWRGRSAATPVAVTAGPPAAAGRSPASRPPARGW